MARPEVTGKSSHRAHGLTRKRAGRTVTEWCYDYHITRRTFEHWQKKGIGPAITQPAGPNGRIIITDESDAEWKRKHTALAAVIENAAE
jgi:hypothetical protein